jgi:hypothetical protein
VVVDVGGGGGGGGGVGGGGGGGGGGGRNVKTLGWLASPSFDKLDLLFCPGAPFFLQLA